jgi:hypothetical protein
MTTAPPDPPPGPPPGGVARALDTHDMVAQQLRHIAEQVHELRNQTMVLENNQAAEAEARAVDAEERRQANAGDVPRGARARERARLGADRVRHDERGAREPLR